MWGTLSAFAGGLRKSKKHFRQVSNVAADIRIWHPQNISQTRFRFSQLASSPYRNMFAKHCTEMPTSAAHFRNSNSKEGGVSAEGWTRTLVWLLRSYQNVHSIGYKYVSKSHFNLLKPNGYICITDFNIPILCITPTKRTCKFDMILTINSCCFPK
jgi:hypothetical protein